MINLGNYIKKLYIIDLKIFKPNSRIILYCILVHNIFFSDNDSNILLYLFSFFLELTYNIFCIPESFNSNISYQLFDYKITLEN